MNSEAPVSVVLAVGAVALTIGVVAYSNTSRIVEFGARHWEPHYPEWFRRLISRLIVGADLRTVQVRNGRIGGAGFIFIGGAAILIGLLRLAGVMQ